MSIAADTSDDSAKRLDSTSSHQYVAFQLGANTLLSSLSCIDEIVDLMPLKPVPGTASWFLGLGAQKGQLLPVSDLGRYSGGAASVESTESRLLVLNNGEERIGLAVDEILGLVNTQTDVESPDSAGDSVSDGTLVQSLAGTLPARLLPLVLDRQWIDGQSALLLNLLDLLQQPEFLAIADCETEVEA